MVDPFRTLDRNPAAKNLTQSSDERPGTVLCPKIHHFSTGIWNHSKGIITIDFQPDGQFYPIVHNAQNRPHDLTQTISYSNHGQICLAVDGTPS